MNRRKLLSTASALGWMALFPTFLPTANAGHPRFTTVKKTSWGKDLKPTTLDAITSHNNFYEFGSGKSDPKKKAHSLKTEPWRVEISGHVEKPGIFDYEELIQPHLMEERIYRMRCVEAWSMVIPWVGIPLAKIIKQLNPTSKAKYVAFQTLLDSEGSPYEVVSTPFMIDGVDIRARKRAPLVGENNFDVLQELGFSESEIADLAEQGIFTEDESHGS